MQGVKEMAISTIIKAASAAIVAYFGYKGILAVVTVVQTLPR